MRNRFLIPIAVLAAVPAAAQIVSVGPFTGTLNESFEAPTMPGFNACLSSRVFQNTADLCTPGNAGAHVTTGWGFSCSIFPQSGSWFYGSAGGYSEYTFDSTVARFGGYFGNNTPSSDTVTVEFYDSANNLLGSDNWVAMNDCTWNWHGWQSNGAGIKRITVTNAAWSGGFVMMDGMEVDGGAGTIGTPYCSANANTTGQPAQISASGSAAVANNSLTLGASQMPAGQFGIFITSMTQGFVPTPGGSQGNLCLAGNIGRYNAPGQLFQTSAAGTGSLAVDLGNTPSPTGPVAIAAGQTWNFQCWYRDFIAGSGATSNFSNGLSIQFQ